MHAGFETPDALAKYARLDRFLAGLKGDVYPVPNSPLHDRISRLMFDRLRASHPFAPGARVLDVCCGQGAALALFRDAGLDATGIALGEDVAVCRRQGFDVREMDLAFLEFADESFDLVWCRHALEHSIFPMFTLAELFRVLRPGGVLYLELPAPETASGHETNPNHYSVFGRRMWLELIRRAGFAGIDAVDIRFTAGLGPDTYWAFTQRRPPAAAITAMARATPAAVSDAVVADRAAARERVLVCILGQARAHRLTWANFRDNVLDPLGADLAVCIGTDAGFDPANPYFASARHRWTIAEFADYGDGFEMARRALGGIDDWRIAMTIRDQWLGGINGPNAHPGSAGILIFFRWFLLHNLLKDGLLDRYDRFIVTRSDFFYLCPHPPIECLDRTALWIPDGEDYGGFTDRHLVVSAGDLVASLGLIDDILLRPQQLVSEMSRRNDWNLEKYIKMQFERRQIADRVRRFPYVMFSVRDPAERSRWAWGQYDAETRMIVKYKSERDEAMKYQKILKSREDWETYLSVRDELR